MEDVEQGGGKDAPQTNQNTNAAAPVPPAVPVPPGTDVGVGAASDPIYADAPKQPETARVEAELVNLASRKDGIDEGDACGALVESGTGGHFRRRQALDIVHQSKGHTLEERLKLLSKVEEGVGHGSGTAFFSAFELANRDLYVTLKLLPKVEAYLDTGAPITLED